MMTNEKLDALSDEERCAWIDSLNEDESAILYCPIGHRHTFVFVSLVKHLLALDFPATDRLKFLQWLDNPHGSPSCTSPPIVAAIEPMCEDGY
jgi:hypothetical protein